MLTAVVNVSTAGVNAVVGDPPAGQEWVIRGYTLFVPPGQRFTITKGESDVTPLFGYAQAATTVSASGLDLRLGEENGIGVGVEAEGLPVCGVIHYEAVAL